MDAWYGAPMSGVLVPLIRGFHFFYRRLAAPKSADEDVRRKELILNVIVTVFIAMMLCLFAIVVRNIAIARAGGYAYHGVSATVAALLVAYFVVIYVLSRNGWIKTASWLLVAFLAAGTFYSSYRWGVGLPSALLCYGLIISIASILLGVRTALFIGIVCIAFIVGRGRIESRLGALPAWRTDPVQSTDSMQYAAVILLTTVVSLLAVREIEKSLERARRSERELKEKNDSLEAIVEERTRKLKQAHVEKMSGLYRFVEFGRLSSGVFHDILNPLSAMASTVNDLALTLRSEGPAVTEKIDEAVRASRRMERFMESVRKQIQAHHVDTVFSANEEVEEALTLFEYAARSRQTMIEFLADEAVYIRGNPLKFQQILTNLVSNALDSYEAPIDPESRIVIISVKAAGASMELSVRDRGCGMDKATLGRIFDPFFTTKEEHRGIGLGLSTTKHIVETDFGGAIAVRSAPGAGSAFTVSIPRMLISMPASLSSHEEIPSQWLEAFRDSGPEESA